jgi:hypothetical protein
MIDISGFYINALKSKARTSTLEKPAQSLSMLVHFSCLRHRTKFTGANVKNVNSC